MINFAWKGPVLGLPDFGLFFVVFLSNFKLKTSCFPVKCPQNDNSDHCFPYEINWCHWVPFWWYKHIRMDSNDRNAFSEIFSFPKKNFGGPYLGSPTWYRGCSVLKIIVWSSSLHTNIFLALGKHNKGTKASEVSQIWKFSIFQNFPFLTQKPIFWGSKSWKWMEKLNVTYHPLKICSLVAKIANLHYFFHFSPFFCFFPIFFPKNGKNQKRLGQWFSFFQFFVQNCISKNLT